MAHRRRRNPGDSSLLEGVALGVGGYLLWKHLRKKQGHEHAADAAGHLKAAAKSMGKAAQAHAQAGQPAAAAGAAGAAMNLASQAQAAQAGAQVAAPGMAGWMEISR